MTIVVFRDGVLAADSLCTSADDLRVATVVKVRRIARGRLAITGQASAAYPLVRWIEQRMPDPQPTLKDGSVIWWPDEGQAEIFSDGGREPIGDAPFHAFGHGRPVALGALAMGATAEQAVEAAIRFDVYCGGPVVALR